MGRFREFAPLVDSEIAASGSYLTDERKLFRVLGRLSVGDETLIELEDCTTLDVWLVAVTLVARLRRVRALAADRVAEGS